MSTKKIVLVTGGSGFIASHVVVAVLNAGYKVRATIRSLKRADSVREKLQIGGISREQSESEVEFVEADLQSDAGWDEATSGCEYVLHVASPFPAASPSHEDDLINPACEGTLRVLKAAKRSGIVKRVVVTSSGFAITAGHAPRSLDGTNPFTEEDWAKLDSPDMPLGAYEKSKILAEKAALQWAKEESEASGDSIELALVNPGLVFGPTLGPNDDSTSLEIPRRLVSGRLSGLPKLFFGVVDVRDVADLHVRVMEHPSAAGNRYLAISDEPCISMKDMSRYLKEGLDAAKSKRVPTRELPNFALRLFGMFDPAVRMVLPNLGKTFPLSNAKAKAELGWEPRSAKEATLSTARSLLKYGKVIVTL
jgi:nucleoside-diphosphate-sugar epimerase